MLYYGQTVRRGRRSDMPAVSERLRNRSGAVPPVPAVFRNRINGGGNVLSGGGTGEGFTLPALRQDVSNIVYHTG